MWFALSSSRYYSVGSWHGASAGLIGPGRLRAVSIDENFAIDEQASSFRARPADEARC